MGNVLRCNQWLSSPRQRQWRRCCVRGQQTLQLRTFVGLVCRGRRPSLERLLIHHSAFTFGFVSKPLTWEDPLQASQSLLEASFTFRFVLVNAGLQKLLVDILKLLVYFRVQFPIHYVNADKDVSTEVAYAIFSLSAR
jgi:hypothetical protein